MIIQFICRGNVFRSFIAETYLKSLEIPGVQVYSRGTVASRDKQKNAKNFPKILQVLDRHGIKKFAKSDYGEDITQSLFDESDIVVFLNQRAYDEAGQSYHLPKETYIWNISDMDDVAKPPETDEDFLAFVEKAFDEIVDNVDDLRVKESF